jgi:hypothetical protein
MVLAGSKPVGSEYTKVKVPPYCGFSAAGFVVIGAAEVVADRVVAGGGVVVVVIVGAQEARKSAAQPNADKNIHTHLLLIG